jgi:hypothetical protein
MNAKKGDIVLTPGDGSLIAYVLAAVDPPQAYPHSGIMTRNRDEITHSTGSMSRMTDSESDFVGAGGFRPDVLKYVWPGVITQTVRHAVDGESMTDPETGKTYTVSGFKSLPVAFGSAGSTAVALVVKPDPLKETPAVRAQLNSIADFAAMQAGKSHYRFFCYTDPTIGLTDKAPAEAKWAAGTFPTICSSLIWMSIQQSGVMMEGGLDLKDKSDSEDVNEGARTAAGTPDGLYLYDADERRNAGEVLYERLAQLASQFGFPDVKEDIGNQVLNTFASNWSDDDATESDKWRQAGDANAVSPHDLTFYDAPLYGHSEPLIYRGERIEEVTVYRWKLVKEKGAITGRVRFKGQPVKGADVVLTTQVDQSTHSGPDGTFKLEGVPAGDWIVEAQAPVGGVLMSAQSKVKVKANQTTNVDIDLAPPSPSFRRVVIDGTIQAIGYEFAAAVDPHNEADIHGFADLDFMTTSHVVKTFDCIADNDTRGRLTLTFDLNPDNSVTVKTTMRTYDGTDKDETDYGESALEPFVLKPDAPAGSWHIAVEDDNFAQAWFTLRNMSNQS